MSEVFVDRLRAFAGTAKEQLAAALKNSTCPARVRSAFDLPMTHRSTIERAIRETFTVDTQIQFETAPELVSGIELSTGGQKVAWSIAEYLATLANITGELLQQDVKTKSKSDVKSNAVAYANSEAKAATKLEPKTEAKADLRPESKSELEPVCSASKGIQ